MCSLLVMDRTRWTDERVDDLRAAAHLPVRCGAGATAIARTEDVAPGDGCAGEDAEAPEEGPLPASEANATVVAYAQVRSGGTSLPDIKRQIERDCIARALAETKGNITRAAALLGMKRPRLSQLVKQYGLAAVLSEGS